MQELKLGQEEQGKQLRGREDEFAGMSEQLRVEAAKREELQEENDVLDEEVAELERELEETVVERDKFKERAKSRGADLQQLTERLQREIARRKKAQEEARRLRAAAGEGETTSSQS